MSLRCRGSKREVARGFRKDPTEAEARAWSVLRNRGLGGLKFRRQHVIDPFIVDFYCAELRLVVEIDGGIHSEPSSIEYDAARTSYIRARGISVIRVPNHSANAKGLTQALHRFLRSRPPLPPRGKEDGGEG
jgi:very-short-patch-repair endonuclease